MHQALKGEVLLARCSTPSAELAPATGPSLSVPPLLFAEERCCGLVLRLDLQLSAPPSAPPTSPCWKGFLPVFLSLGLGDALGDDVLLTRPMPSPSD